jgi:hypothetical protein
MSSLNRAFTRVGMRRRYEAWFLRFGLTDGSGAWWLRYLLTSPGRGGCAVMARGAPVQVWATWFPREGEPETFIQEYGLESLHLGPQRGQFFLETGASRIQEDSCRGVVEDRGQRVSWDLRYRSRFGVTLSNKGWIGFSRTPHSDGVFSGEIRLGERVFRGEPLGIGVQGHNCGFRHRNFWTWMHACLPRPDGSISTLEALVYEMPLGLVFRKAILWHRGRAIEFCRLRETQRERQGLRWAFSAAAAEGLLEVEADGGGASLHLLNYVKTDCSGRFEVSNNSRARARVRMELRGAGREELTTEDGAVVEMTGEYRV